MSTPLTEEQKRKIEENRQKALARRAERLAAQQNQNKQTNGGQNISSVPTAHTSNNNSTGNNIQLQKHQESFNSSRGIQENALANSDIYVAPNSSAASAKRPLSVASDQPIQATPNRNGPGHFSFSAGQKPLINPVKDLNSSKPLTEDIQSFVGSAATRCSQAKVDTALPNSNVSDVSISKLNVVKSFSNAATNHHTQEGPGQPNNSYKTPETQAAVTSTGTDSVSSTANVVQFYGSGTKGSAPSSNKATEGKVVTNSTPVKKSANAVRGRCLKHQEDRFRVEVGYNAELIALFKTIPSKNYDPATKMWNFSMEDYTSLLTEVQRLQSAVLKPLEGMEDVDLPTRPVTSSSGTGINALLAMCNNWQRPNATLRGRCLLTSRTRFEMEIGYHAEIIGLFKQMNSRNYDMKTRKWSFLLEDYQKLIEAVRGIQQVEIEPLPRPVIQAFASQFEKTSINRLEIPDVDLSGVDTKLLSSLMPFQQQGVSFAISREGRLLLADDMGLGKTIQAICIAAYYRKEWPLLVVAPSSVRFTWAEAFHQWLPSINPQSINVIVTSKDGQTSSRINIVSFDLLGKMDKLIAASFKVIIIDESHFLKNVKTARCKAAMPLLKNAKRVILLSGTPAMSRPAELYTQIAAVRPTFFPRFHDFGIRYCDAKQMPWGWDYSGSSNMNELKLLLEESIMIRRLKSEVLSQLPAKQRKMVVIAPEGINSKTKAALAAAAKEMTKGFKSKVQEKEALLMFYNRTAEAKVRCVNEYIMDLLESGREKFLVFAHHKLVLDSVCEELGKKRVGYIRIDGTTSSADRQSLCHKFQFSDKSCIAVLSITAANMGLTLSSADLVVFAELFWNPGVLIQAEDRVHRIGQTSSVNIHYLVAKGTADDFLWPMIQEKIKILGQAGLSETNFSETTESTDFFYKDPKQKTIYDLFQRSFSEDSVSQAADEALFLEACEEVDQGHPSDDYSESPCKKRKIEDFFGT
ncbi:SWI/SNF-related matrix-associated actin-dependent regulator of chromatin subfamily A-like protein 1 [Discoglossus pictus]